jgi:hypothetical protein
MAGVVAVTARRPCPPAPGPLEEYAAHFDDLFAFLAQRRGFREYLAGLLAPRERNKTLTALAGAEPVVKAHSAADGQSNLSRRRSSSTAMQSPIAQGTRPLRCVGQGLSRATYGRSQGRFCSAQMTLPPLV